MVAGGFEEPTRRLICVVLAMLLDFGELGKGGGVRSERDQAYECETKVSRLCYDVKREVDWLDFAKQTLSG